ncbi:MAG: hypothetical protein JEY94_08345 [Melioribacteraceae bacterium]|nr:hypothetical protein [Melioribacteraceae bacterium]
MKLYFTFIKLLNSKGSKMSEMLGNQYFMARKFSEAEKELEECSISNPKNKLIKKKLIICYVETGKLINAIELFISLIREDIDIIINTHPIDDDCPCPELIYNYENSLDLNNQGEKDLLILGILWLYCDFNKSMEKFEEAVQKKSSDIEAKTILRIMKAKELELKQKDNNPYIS